MNLEQYSIVLSIALVALSVATLVSVLVYFFSATGRRRMLMVDYFVYIKMIGIVAVISTLGALTYQFGYSTPVCEYCWWQRIFMFPIDFVVIGSIVHKIKRNEYIIGALALVGAVIASYHYYYHYQSVILGRDVMLPCSSLGIVPSCTESPVLVFGFITIPLMAAVAFVVIVWLSFLAKKSS